jgi:hypothetical protein
MASIKQLKKDIDNEIFGLIADCFLFSELHPDKKSGEIASIIEDAVRLRNDLFTRAGNPADTGNSKDTRKHYRVISSDLDEGIKNLCERLSAISKKKKK